MVDMLASTLVVVLLVATIGSLQGGKANSQTNINDNCNFIFNKLASLEPNQLIT